ncbi:MAG TPA: hypothetical protein VKW04_20660 [Planctomycetota bacterium]|nr:hypothetical protein [Planctomycetota bacterium]
MAVDRNQLPTLCRQLESMTHRAEAFQSREQEEQDWFSAVLESLRSTHLMIQNGADPRTVVQEFVLEVSDSGKLVMKQAGLPVPVDEDYLKHVFETMEVDLVPGQLLLLEPRMAKWAIEESLWGLELDRALSGTRGELTDAPPPTILNAWSQKRDLVMANLIAEELLERKSPLPSRIPRAV